MYIKVSKSSLLHKVVYGAAIISREMSIKEESNDVTDMLKVQSDDQSVRISMENLKLKDNQEEYVSRNQYHLVRGQINQLKVRQFLATESLLKLMKNAFYFTSKPF